MNSESEGAGLVGMVFDGAAFSHRLMDDLSLQQQVATNFIADMPYQLDSLKQAVSSQDAEQIAALAHKIKGAAANMAAEQMHVIALDIELLAKKGAMTEAADKAQSLSDAFEQVSEALKQALQLS
jgi:HPt (histidine-containing phosphotransfer) domain-containing protein